MQAGSLIHLPSYWYSTVITKQLHNHAEGWEMQGQRANVHCVIVECGNTVPSAPGFACAICCYQLQPEVLT